MRFDHELLLRVRVELGLTQEELAEAVGIDVRTYRRYESGEVNAGGFAVRHPSRRRIVTRLCRELGVPEADLLVAETEEQVAEIPATKADREDKRAWMPRVAHALQRARHFVGREALLGHLAAWSMAERPSARVIGLVGLGGVGKTAVAERLVEDLIALAPPGGQRAGRWVWSFFDNPRIEEFLADAAGYFGRSAHAPGGTGVEALLSAVLEALQGGEPHLLVVDGLELIQSPGNAVRAYGEIEDPIVRRFLLAMVRGLGNARMLVTSRFELTDLGAWEGSGAETIRLEPLSESEAEEALRRWGVHGDVAGLARRVGGHPLAVAMTGSYVGSFLGGDAASVAEMSLRDAARDDVLARRLSATLTAYFRALEPRVHDVLARLAAFVEGASIAILLAIAGAGEAVAGRLAGASSVSLQRDIALLRRLGLVFSPRPGVYSTHPFVRQFFIETAEMRPAEIRAAAIRAGSPAPSPYTRPLVGLRDSSQVNAHEALLGHLIDAGQVEQAYVLYSRVIGGFSQLGLQVGDMARGARMVRAFAASSDPDSLSGALSPVARAQLAYEWGLFAAALGDLGFARRCYHVHNRIVGEALDVAPLRLVTGLRTLAYTERLAGDFAAAAEHLDASIALAERAQQSFPGHGGSDALIRGLALRGALYHDLGKVAAAQAQFDRVHALGDRPYARRALWYAEHLMDLGRLNEARAITEANLAACKSLGWAGHMAHCRILLAALALSRGDDVDARNHVTEARRWAFSTGEVEMVLRCHLADAEIALAAGDGARQPALFTAEHGLQMAQACGAGLFVPRFANAASASALAQGRPSQALDIALLSAGSELAWCREAGLRLAGRAASACGLKERAQDYLARADEDRRRLKPPSVGMDGVGVDDLA